MATTYRVEVRGDAREVYLVDADSAEEARVRWAEDGVRVLSEVDSAEVDSVTVE